MTYHFKIRPDVPKGYFAECVEIPDCATQGDTMNELELMMRDVLNLYLDEPADSSIVFPLPDRSLSGSDIVEVPVEIRIAQKTALRWHRKQAGLSQAQAAKVLGAKSVYAYQRYESGDTSPTLDTLTRLKRVFPGLDLNMIAEPVHGRRRSTE